MPQPEAGNWHALPAADLLEALGTSSTGLSQAEAARRLERFGPNEGAPPERDPWYRILGRQLSSVVVLLLAVAALVAAAFGETAEAVAVGVVLLINVVIGFVVELRARGAMEALEDLEVPEALVLRDGRELALAARELVPGDVVVLAAGDAVPADSRLLVGSELSTIEAALTGESLPVVKSVDPVPEDTVLAERCSMVYRGTLVAAGDGRALVVATGGRSELGRIRELLVSLRSEPTPLEQRLTVLGRRMVVVALGLGAVVAAVGILRGNELWLMLETGLALAIAAVPEGLPVVTTITLALGLQRMAARQALVRRLPAVETLGSATVVCSDKTGTLTSGRMSATTLWTSERELDLGAQPAGSVPTARAALHCAAQANRAALDPEGEEGVGDPTEVALLAAARRAGLERSALLAAEPETGEVPFSSRRMLMATFHRPIEGGREGDVIYVKGAARALISRATSLLGPGATLQPLDDAGRDRLLEVNGELAGRGLRVLALARGTLAAGCAADEEALSNLTFLGLIGLFDPPSEGVAETIEALRDAGVRTIMLTGDQARTAEAVGRSLSILGPGQHVVDGRELPRETEELSSTLATLGGLSRVTPKDKLRVVRAFQQAGDVVAMLGDGVNDAPALRQADIGVAMGGRGTDVARQAADIVLADDRFETIAVALREGRTIFTNIRRFVFYLFSCNLAEILVLFVSGLLGLPLPLLPLQLLWLNLVTDVFPALALAVEPAPAGIMSEPPRPPREGILTRDFTARIAGYAVVLTIATLGAFVLTLEAGGPAATERAVTVAFASLAFGQLFHLFNARSGGRPLGLRRLLTNRWAWGAVVLVAALQLAALFLPWLQRPLGTVALEAGDWLRVAVASILPLLVGQALAWFRPRKER